MNENHIMVSVIIPTYNHERFIKQAIESVLMQKVNFNYEVLIGEDCSKDKTRAVLKEMERTLPNYFHIFYRNENTGAGQNFKDLFNRAQGKYLIVLEGDDYWIYEYKLQKQVDFLENNMDYIATAHNTLVVDKYGNKLNDYKYPECKNDEYTLYDFQNFLLMGQTATILYRNFIRYHLFDDIKINVDFPGDQRKNFLFASHGKVKCFQEQWSAYRYVNNEGSSFSANVKFDKEFRKKELEFLHELRNYSFNILKDEDAKKVSETKYLFVFFCDCLLKKNIDYNFYDWIKEFLKAKYKFNFIKFFISRMRLKVRKLL